MVDMCGMLLGWFVAVAEGKTRDSLVCVSVASVDTCLGKHDRCPLVVHTFCL